jgi:hypothetical protein
MIPQPAAEGQRMETGFTDEPPRPAGPAPVTEVEYVLTPDDHAACRLFLLDRQNAEADKRAWLPSPVVLAIVLLPGFLTVLGCLLWQRQIGLVVGWAAFAGAAVFLFLSLRRGAKPADAAEAETPARKRLREYYRLIGEQNAGRRDRVALGADGFVESNETREDDGGVETIRRAETRVSWLAVERIDLLPEYTIFTIRQKGWMFVPKRAFADEASFRAFAEAAERLRQEAVHRATGAFTTALRRADNIRPAK